MSLGLGTQIQICRCVWVKPSRISYVILCLRSGDDQVNRTEKTELIETLQSTLSEATSVVVTHQTGLTVAESSELRARPQFAAFRNGQASLMSNHN